MDNLTHTAVGLFLSRAGMKRWSPGATTIAILGANAPDIDVVTRFGGSLKYLEFHRHLTHSLIAMPVMALLALFVAKFAFRRKVNWKGGFLIALLAVASHLALDLTNVYGIRLFLPFSANWLRLDTTSVIDLWIWGIFLVAVVAPFVGRLVGGEITSGAARDQHHGRGAAIFALIFLLLYDSGRAVLHARAVGMLESRVYDGRPPDRVAAMPDSANPFKWRGLVETDTFYSVQQINLLGDFDPETGFVLHKPEPGPAIEAARRDHTMQEFLKFAQFPLWRVSPVPEPENGKEVTLTDMRFAGFRANAILDSRLRVLESSFRWGAVPPR